MLVISFTVAASLLNYHVHILESKNGQNVKSKWMGNSLADSVHIFGDLIMEIELFV